jgi:competence protein ComEA
LARDARAVESRVAESKVAEVKAEPAKVEVSAPAPVQPVAVGSPRKLINVNTATQSELELLPGIGPSLAKRIMEYRASHAAFKRVEDLDPVKGIGPRMIEKLRPLVGFE